MATKATLTIRQARVDEFDQVMDFYTKMIDEMRDTDFDVCWEHGVHPSPAFLRASVEAGEVYVGLVDAGADGAGEGRAPRIASAMVLNGEGDAGYERAPWRVMAEPDEVLVVHVLGTLPAYHGRGFARAMVEACIDVAHAAGKKAVRLDTFTTNVRAQNLYESCGFVNCGIYEGFYNFLGLSAVMYEHAL
ncbi:GNAT family N-acetyltransferase [Eggerthella sp. NSJ-70]|uniref:GNAT family N-acetyltransferase n=1 Tax=Eggerthella hominis TaxID=2763043 RepID=A0ABR7BQA7_9ACTN|nr:GNAT family N-acetyltransferase [Eggerthella hominis]MBC5583807.1 GNAT family N-acetyltransferase [Eggerthella hominis]